MKMTVSIAIKGATLVMGLLMTSFNPALANEESAGEVEGLKVKITRQLDNVTIKHEGKDLVIERVQDQKNTINPSFSKTSRKCPPFCVQPIKLADGVETLGTREMLDYLKRQSDGDSNIEVIDSRSAAWVERGTIPGTRHIHFKTLSLKSGDPDEIADIFEEVFGVQRNGDFWDYSYAKTLVLYCNGMWYGQAPTNIKTLLRLGYPPNKLKWYRGGMQVWELLGLNTVTPRK